MKQIIPIYGYGWSRGQEFIDVPKPFDAELKPRPNGSLNGHCTTKSHAFFGAQLVLTARNGISGHYNITITPCDDTDKVVGFVIVE